MGPDHNDAHACGGITRADEAGAVSPSMMRSRLARPFVRPSSGLHRGGASASALHRPASAAKKARPAYDPRMIRPASAAPKTPAAAKLDRLLADEKPRRCR